MTKPELLAPVGCEENFYAAVKFGANAVYIGLSDFSARKNAGNFTLERLPYILSYAHAFGVKVYVAVNTVIKNSELEKYFQVIERAYLCGTDAFIVQDLFLGRYLKRRFPDICLHLSTQAGINNLDGAKLASSYGFSRVILARETPFEEIKKIAAFMETEVFVHGALCTCFSGHCYFSSFIGGKSGNRGLCRQPCRKIYKYEGKGIKDEKRYALSLADLSLHNRVNELITAGVKSFKIEGRMRSFEYVCASCDFYSDILNGIFDRKKYENLLKTYNRGNCTEGLGFGQDDRLISDRIQNHCGVIVGRVASVSGDVLQLNNLKTYPVVGDCFKILDGFEKGNATAVLSKKGGVVVKYKGNAQAGDYLSITKDISLIEKYKSYPNKLLSITARLIAHIGEPPILYVNDMKFVGNGICQEAKTSAVTKSEIKENLRKVDVYPFAVTPSCEVDNNLFLLKSCLNELRARAYSGLFNSFACLGEKRIKNADNIIDYSDFYYRHDLSVNSITAIIDETFSGSLEVFDNVVFCPSDYNDDNNFKTFFNKVGCFNVGKTINTFLYLPPFLSSLDERIIEKRMGDFDGLYCEGTYGLFIAKRLKKKLFCGVEFNVTNNLTYNELVEFGADNIAVSKELSYGELEKMPLSGGVLCGGGIKIMSLEYCPFGKKCSDCKASDRFILKDYDGRAFRVRRYKLSSCRFEVYNNLPLKSELRFSHEIYDFNLLNKEETAYYLNRCSKSDGRKDYDELKITATSGNLKNGVE